eukprot:2173291-Rhodomonas_salina.4
MSMHETKPKAAATCRGVNPSCDRAHVVSMSSGSWTQHHRLFLSRHDADTRDGRHSVGLVDVRLALQQQLDRLLPPLRCRRKKRCPPILTPDTHVTLLSAAEPMLAGNMHGRKAFRYCEGAPIDSRFSV